MGATSPQYTESLQIRTNSTIFALFAPILIKTDSTIVKAVTRQRITPFGDTYQTHSETLATWGLTTFVTSYTSLSSVIVKHNTTLIYTKSILTPKDGSYPT